MDAGKRTGQARGKLRDFSTQLAARLKAASAATSEPLRLAVRIGDDSYLLDMNAAAEIIALPQIVPVPWTKPWYRGLAIARGRLIGVVDLAQFKGGAPLAAEQAMQLLVLGETLGVNAALLVTRAFGLRNLNELEALGHAGHDAALWETVRYRDLDGTQLTELNLQALASSEQFVSIGV